MIIRFHPNSWKSPGMGGEETNSAGDNRRRNLSRQWAWYYVYLIQYVYIMYIFLRVLKCKTLKSCSTPLLTNPWCQCTTSHLLQCCMCETKPNYVLEWPLEQLIVESRVMFRPCVLHRSPTSQAQIPIVGPSGETPGADTPPCESRVLLPSNLRTRPPA